MEILGGAEGLKIEIDILRKKQSFSPLFLLGLHPFLPKFLSICANFSYFDFNIRDKTFIGIFWILHHVMDLHRSHCQIFETTNIAIVGHRLFWLNPLDNDHPRLFHDRDSVLFFGIPFHVPHVTALEVGHH